MNDSPTLFDAEPRPQHRDPIYLQPRRSRPVVTVEPAFLSARISDGDTATAAAQSITPGRTERVILAHFERCGMWLTDDELCRDLGNLYHGPTVRTARSRLSKAGVLVDSGKRGRSARGRAQICWRLA